MFKRANVVMLPTNEKATNKPFSVGITLCNDNKLRIGNPIGKSETRQHLYITSDDKIEEDDISIPYCITWANGKPEVFCSNNRISDSRKLIAKRVIASTDVKLNLPQPSTSFIAKYVESYNKGNIITDVMVEYEIDSMLNFAARIELNSTYGIKHTSKTKEDLERLYELGCTLKPKINLKDNTITIRKIKDSWTKEEVVQLLSKTVIGVSDKEWNDWIDKNTNI